jgi:hypothetical protein
MGLGGVGDCHLQSDSGAAPTATATAWLGDGWSGDAESMASLTLQPPPVRRAIAKPWRPTAVLGRYATPRPKQRRCQQRWDAGVDSTSLGDPIAERDIGTYIVLCRQPQAVLLRCRGCLHYLPMYNWEGKRGSQGMWQARRVAQIEQRITTEKLVPWTARPVSGLQGHINE